MSSLALARRSTGALAITLGLAALAWVVALREMDGMDMGYATELGSAASFAVAWIAMMAAMMLPGAAAVTVRVARVVPFLATYLVVWAAVGVAVYAALRSRTARSPPVR